MIKKRPNGRSKLRFSNPRQATALFCAELIESHEKFGDQFKRGVEDSQSSELQTTNLDWIGNLSKLTSLRLRFPSATSVMQGLAALQQPSALDTDQLGTSLQPIEFVSESFRDGAAKHFHFEELVNS